MLKRLRQDIKQSFMKLYSLVHIKAILYQSAGSCCNSTKSDYNLEVGFTTILR